MKKKPSRRRIEKNDPTFKAVYDEDSDGYSPTSTDIRRKTRAAYGLPVIPTDVASMFSRITKRRHKDA